MKLLLLSNSTLHGRGYLDHAFDEILDHLSGARRLAFAPFALKDHAAYGAQVAERFASSGIEVTTLPADGAAPRIIAAADGVFVGGGNTFRLLRALQDLGLIEAIRSGVAGGLPYIGSSAGTVVAAPTMKTTNDMPIVQPKSLDALALVPFQINPHYQDPDPSSSHMGETRETRLGEYLEENETPVLGLREGSWIRQAGGRLGLGGSLPARLFRRGAGPEEIPPGSDLSFLAGR
jgi:dipeptidase E